MTIVNFIFLEANNIFLKVNNKCWGKNAIIVAVLDS